MKGMMDNLPYIIASEKLTLYANIYYTLFTFVDLHKKLSLIRRIYNCTLSARLDTI